MNIWRHLDTMDTPHSPGAGISNRVADCALCPVRDKALCSALGADELLEVGRLIETTTVGQGDPIFFEGDAAEHVFTLRSGVVRLVRYFPDGRRSIIGFLHGGDFMGMPNEHGQYAVTAEAVTRVDVCRLKADDLGQLGAQYPAMEHQLLTMTLDRLKLAEDQMMLLGRKTAKEKVAAFLLASSDWEGGMDAFNLPMSRTDIADYLGLTIETVSRTLSRFSQMALIKLPSPHAVELLDREELTAIARPEM